MDPACPGRRVPGSAAGRPCGARRGTYMRFRRSALGSGEPDVQSVCTSRQQLYRQRGSRRIAGGVSWQPSSRHRLGFSSELAPGTRAHRFVYAGTRVARILRCAGELTAPRRPVDVTGDLFAGIATWTRSTIDEPVAELEHRRERWMFLGECGELGVVALGEYGRSYLESASRRPDLRRHLAATIRAFVVAFPHSRRPRRVVQALDEVMRARQDHR